MTEQFEGRVALVTGGASGIGRGVVERFLKEGASVGIADLDVAACTALADAHPGRVLTIPTDVTIEASALEAVRLTTDSLGPIGIAVNAAGIASRVVPLHEQSVDDFRRVMRVNVDGTFIVMAQAARAMIAANLGGVIINISSVNAAQAGRGMGAYCTSKAAVAMLTQVAALDLAPHDIRVLAVAPGLIQTPMTARSITSRPDVLGPIVNSTPLGRVGTVDDVASTVLFLASDQASFSTGSTFYVDGGIRLSAPPPRAAIDTR